MAQAFDNLKANDPIRMAAATAFFSFFALPPILIILSQLFGGLLNSNDRRVSWQLFRKLADLFGDQSARELQKISQNLQQAPTTALSTVLSLFILLMAATTLFVIIKNSLNQLWSVKHAANRNRWYGLLDRVIAISIILFSGMLVLASLAINHALVRVHEQVLSDSIRYEWLRITGTQLFSIGTLTVWIAIMFKYLPDIRIHWWAVWIGSLVTSVLIELGEQVLDQLLIQSPVRLLYGTSGGIILVLLFVFYASLIFYFGASFTRYYAEWIHLEAKPGAHAVGYEITEVDDESSA
ncbi:YihY/virulence factor BrkB family protein [Spirosoma flavus]